MGKIKHFLQRMLYGYKADSQSYEKYLKGLGVMIGKNFKIYCPRDTVIDIQNPFLLQFGDNVAMTGPVSIMTHDYSWKVVKILDGRILGNQRAVTIGNNVFIGWGATILGGSTIGDNVVIAAGSVVSSVCESNSVYGGIPAKKIMTIEEYINRRTKKQLEEAQMLYRHYITRYNKKPPVKLFNSYFPLFTSSQNYVDMCDIFKDRIELENTGEKTLDFLKQNRGIFNSFEEFEQSVSL